MSADDTGRLIYLAVLGCAVVFWFLAQARQSMNRTLQNASVWVLIFIGTVAAVGLWNDIRQSSFFATVDEQAGTVTIPRAPDGHYYLTAEINGQPVRLVVDTGATDVVLTREDAAAVGLHPDRIAFYAEAATANGKVRVAPVTLDTVAIGPFTDARVSASVNDGEMKGSLLGMSYLQRFAKIEISGGRMVLTR